MAGATLLSLWSTTECAPGHLRVAVATEEVEEIASGLARSEWWPCGLIGCVERDLDREDPWGHPYVLEVVEGQAWVVSLGPDGQSFTEDDIEVVVDTGW